MVEIGTLSGLSGGRVQIGDSKNVRTDGQIFNLTGAFSDS